MVIMSSGSLAATRPATDARGAAAFQAGVLAVTAAAAFSYYYMSTGRSSRATTSSTTTTPRSVPSSDRLGLWQQRWTDGKIGFHRADVHPSLQRFADETLLGDVIGGGARILVPLCGKTVDMQFLALKRPVGEVVGVDGVPAAIEDFAKEHPDLNVRAVESVGKYKKWKGESISLLTGDFFDLDVATAGGSFDAAWDRGSLVAIHPSLREKYVDKMGELLSKPDGRVLLSTYVRGDGDLTKGPPFSIDEAEVRRLYEAKPWVESVELLDSHSAASVETWTKALYMYLVLGNSQEMIFLIKTK